MDPSTTGGTPNSTRAEDQYAAAMHVLSNPGAMFDETSGSPFSQQKLDEKRSFFSKELKQDLVSAVAEFRRQLDEITRVHQNKAATTTVLEGPQLTIQDVLLACGFYMTGDLERLREGGATTSWGVFLGQVSESGNVEKPGRSGPELGKFSSASSEIYATLSLEEKKSLKIQAQKIHENKSWGTLELERKSFRKIFLDKINKGVINLEALGYEAIFLLVDNFDDRIQAVIGTSVGMAYHTLGLSTMNLGVAGFDIFAKQKVLDRYNIAHAKVLEYGCLKELESMLEREGNKRKLAKEPPTTNPATNDGDSSSDSSAIVDRPRKRSNLVLQERDSARADVAKIMLEHWIKAGFRCKRKAIPTKLPPADTMWKMMHEAGKLWAVAPGFDLPLLFSKSKSFDLCKQIIALNSAGGLMIIPRV